MSPPGEEPSIDPLPEDFFDSDNESASSGTVKGDPVELYPDDVEEQEVMGAASATLDPTSSAILDHSHLQDTPDHHEPPSSVLRKYEATSPCREEFDPTLNRSSPLSRSPGSETSMVRPTPPLQTPVDWQEVRQDTLTRGQKSSTPEETEFRLEAPTLTVMKKARSRKKTIKRESNLQSPDLAQLRRKWSCFGTEELLDACSQLSLGNGGDAMKVIELFGRVSESSRENFGIRRQTFEIRDLFHESEYVITGVMRG